ncbi:MAG: nucleotidyltransferase family protein [Planctomycetes bacterium]|nr:nucleotidyltransferase family protein [Planctomycetota bacterium]
MTPMSLVRKNRDRIVSIAARHGARNVRVFGSALRGDARVDSDIDLLVDLEPGRSLLDHVGLWQDLEELLGRRVDVVVEGGISPHLEQRILAEARPL